MSVVRLMLAMFVLLLTAATASAIDLAPSVQITSNPISNADSTATIVITAIDTTDNAGINRIDFYVEGALSYSKNCGQATTCTLTRTIIKTQPATEQYYATAVDIGNNAATSKTIIVTYRGPNEPPVIQTLPNRTILEDSGINLNVTDLWPYVSDTWTADENLTYIISAQTNSSMANCAVSSNRYIDCTTPTGNATGETKITVSATDGQLTQTKDFTLTVQNVNDAPNLIQAVPGISVNEDETNLTLNLSQYFTDIDGQSLSYTYRIGTNNLTAATLAGVLQIIALNNYYGTIPLTIMASDGELQINVTINVVVNSINDAPQFMHPPVNQTTIQDVPFIYQLNHTDVEGDTVTYTDDSALFTINPATGLISFTPAASGNYSITIFITDSGTPNLQTNQTFTLEIRYLPRPGFENSTRNATYTDSALYEIYVDIVNAAPMDTVLFEYNGTNRTATRVQGSAYKINITDLPVGSYNHRWHANYTNGLSNSSQLYNFTVLKAKPEINITLEGSKNMTFGDTGSVRCTINTNQPPRWMMRYQSGTVAFTPITSATNYTDDLSQLNAAIYNYTCYTAGAQNYTDYTANLTDVIINQRPVGLIFNAPETIEYGAPTNASCFADYPGVNATLIINNTGWTTIPGGIDNVTRPFGSYNYTCFILNSMNFVGIQESKITTITKPQTTLTITGQSAAYGSPLNVSCAINHNQSIPQLYRDGSIILNNDATILTAGDYNFTCNATAVNYTNAEISRILTVSKAMPAINLTLNRTAGDYAIELNGTVLINGTILVPANANISVFFNNMHYNGTGNVTFERAFTTTGAYPVTLIYAGAQNYSYLNKTYTIYVGNIARKENITPDTGTHMNQSTTAISLDTNRNMQCRWATTDLDFTSMARNLSTANGYHHTGTITGLILGTNPIYLACTNDTAGTNEELIYTVDNIIDSSSKVINGATATNSTLTISTTVDGNSALSNVTATNSAINNSMLTNCVVINSTVKDYVGSNCYILNSFIDPSQGANPIVNATNVINSNINYSYLDHSTITNSSLNSSTIIRSTVLNVTAQNSTIRDSTVTNTNVSDAIIINNSISAGKILMFNGSIYDATAQGPQKLSDLINQPPVAVSTPSATTITTGDTIIFNASNSYDPNNNSAVLNDAITLYSWNFGDGTTTNTTNIITNHTYPSAGTFIVTLTVTDKYGSTGTTTQTITVNVPYVAPVGGSSGGGHGGGGGGGGYNAIAQTYTYDLESGKYFQRAMTLSDTLNILYIGKTYVFKVSEISRTEGYAVALINSKPYKFMNKEIKKIDLDGNNYYDMEASFVNNFVTRADFRLKPIHEEVPLSERPVITPTIAPAQKPSAAIAEKLQEAQKQLEQEKQAEEKEEETEKEIPTEEKEEGITLLSATIGLAKTLFSAMKGTVTGAVTAGESIDEKGGATGTTITIIIVILGLLGYWAYNRFLD